MKEFGGPIGQKYAKIDRAGREALKQEDVKEFEGFGENLNNRFLTAIEFTPDSEQEVRLRITDRVTQIANDADIDFVIAGRDFPLHCTLGEGLYQGEAESEREELFRGLVNDEQYRILAEEAINESLAYKYLLVDKGNIILTAVEIPDKIIQLRKKLAETYAIHKLKPLPLEHILHITVGRMTKLPDSNKKEQFEKYRQAMIELRHEISQNPLSLTVSQIIKSPTLSFLRSLENQET